MESKQDKGFTLVELLIVIVILGILATVTVFAVRGITDQGQESACEADQKTLQVALESYYAQEGNAAGDTATEADLVTAGLLASASGNYDIVNGAVVAQAGTPEIPAGPGDDGILGTPDDTPAIPASAGGDC